ncbi:NB-ARC domain-containing protein [Phaeobacter sp. JH20_36]|uniref:tetratricopeptide repeat protein n=1 Tax=unclassified Phaeobacter TaxID=2621772 RepID=UPI003A8A9113
MNSTLIPLDLMAARTNRNGEESDTILIMELLYLGEFIVKLTTSMLVAGLDESKEQHQYRIMHRLVRADGVGEWVGALEDILSGPACQDLAPCLRVVRNTLTEKHNISSESAESVRKINEVLKGIYGEVRPLGQKVSLLDWFRIFSTLRNKTRGHGALTPAKCHQWASDLQSSLNGIRKCLPLDTLSWAYIHRNLSGRYRVSPLGGDAARFDTLKVSRSEDLPNIEEGVYLWAEGFRKVELCQSDANIGDFFFPNGAFNGKTFELHSLISDNRLAGEADPYLSPSKVAASSETEGLGQLEVLGNVFTNLPTPSNAYVTRPSLEEEVRRIVLNDRHPIVTLVGKGGIGKTSLTINLLQQTAKSNRFDLIIWFSSRDIDLTSAGPKKVKPQVLTDKEMADEYVKLVGAEMEIKARKVKPVDFFSSELQKSTHGSTLFVFDNFETARNPVDLFHWIDSNIRLPNKALITSRFRDFKADYPIPIDGMETSEALQLVHQTCKALSIPDFLSEEQALEVVESASYHPYVIKILLGEIADTKTYQKPKRIMARQGEILDALFERTFSNLSPLAQRIFLTLSGWKSMVPELAIEAMIHKYDDASLDPESAIDQLVRMSLVERKHDQGKNGFLEVPLSAAVFGQKKLEVSPQTAIIQADVRFLQDMGVTTSTNIQSGIEPRIVSFFKKAAERIERNEATLNQLREVLEFFATNFPKAWLLLADLEYEQGNAKNKSQSADYLRRYLETNPNEADALGAWLQLEHLYRTAGNAIAACSALLKADRIQEQPYYKLSNMANLLNSYNSQARGALSNDHIQSAYKPLSILMEARLPEAKGVDFSRLSWLHLHCGAQDRALEIAELGLEKDPNDTHCKKVVARLR